MALIWERAHMGDGQEPSDCMQAIADRLALYASDIRAGRARVGAFDVGLGCRYDIRIDCSNGRVAYVGFHETPGFPGRPNVMGETSRTDALDRRDEHASHTWVERDRDENDDRIRTYDECACGARRYGCLAKRLAADGTEGWGPVGEQHYTVDPRARP